MYTLPDKTKHAKLVKGLWTLTGRYRAERGANKTGGLPPKPDRERFHACVVSRRTRGIAGDSQVTDGLLVKNSNGRVRWTLACSSSRRQWVSPWGQRVSTVLPPPCRGKDDGRRGSESCVTTLHQSYPPSGSSGGCARRWWAHWLRIGTVLDKLW